MARERYMNKTQQVLREKQTKRVQVEGELPQKVITNAQPLLSHIAITTSLIPSS
jgi:hypothetical protein